jgi:hypothetical protein
VPRRADDRAADRAVLAERLGRVLRVGSVARSVREIVALYPGVAAKEFRYARSTVEGGSIAS